MANLEAVLAHLQKELDENQKTAYAMLISGDETNREVFSYGAGMQHVMRTIEANVLGD